jgi:hypothetical protein
MKLKMDKQKGPEFQGLCFEGGYSSAVQADLLPCNFTLVNCI